MSKAQNSDSTAESIVRVIDADLERKLQSVSDTELVDVYNVEILEFTPTVTGTYSVKVTVETSLNAIVSVGYAYFW